MLFRKFSNRGKWIQADKIQKQVQHKKKTNDSSKHIKNYGKICINYIYRKCIFLLHSL